jgi:DNA anti-recombination protein RmuC
MPDKRPLVIDAKFPLESVTAYSNAASDDDRGCIRGSVVLAARTEA